MRRIRLRVLVPASSRLGSTAPALHVSMAFLSTCVATRFLRPSSGCIVHHVTSDVLPWKVPPGFGIFRTRRWLDGRSRNDAAGSVSAIPVVNLYLCKDEEPT